MCVCVCAGESDDDDDDDDDDSDEDDRRRGRGRGDGTRYGPSGEVLDDYYTYDYDAAADKEMYGEDDGDEAEERGPYSSTYGDFDEVTSNLDGWEHMD